jgi:N-carbamoylputrescine amidase
VTRNAQVPMRRKVQVGMVQMTCSDDPEANVQKALHKIREAAAQGAQIICLQEIFRTRYFCQSEQYEHFALAEPVPGPGTNVLGTLAAELGVVIIASLFEKQTEGIYYNTAAVLDADGSYLGKYRKMHIPDDPLYYEKFYFTPGDLGFRTFRTRFATIGVLICWDQWYPEAARLTALRGAEILFFPTAIGWHPEEKEQVGAAQHQSWEIIQCSHAVANGCYVVSVNRTGHEGESAGGIEFWGQSFVAAPDGQVLARAASDCEEVLVVGCDLSHIEEVRTHWPFFRDRRIDAYGEMTQRYLGE